MKTIARTLLALLLTTTTACAAQNQPASGAAVDARPASPASTADFIGTWKVSLFYSEGQPPSQTTMIIDKVDDGVVSGSFYGSPFGDARARQFQQTLAFTATTEDNSGLYIHSGRLKDNVIYGQTLSVGRSFLMTWKARPAQ